MKLSDAIPGWADARLLRDPIPVEIATLGTVKVAPKSLVDIHDRRAARHQTDLSIFGHTLQGDFKAIRRHLQHRALNPRGRSWLARLARTKEPADIDALLKQGGTPARQAWLFLAWSRYVRQHDFNPRAGLQTRSIQFAVASDYPLWRAYRMRGLPPQREHDFVRLWITRWISAAGLLAFWQRISCHTNQSCISRNRTFPRATPPSGPICIQLFVNLNCRKVVTVVKLEVRLSSIPRSTIAL